MIFSKQMQNNLEVQVALTGLFYERGRLRSKLKIKSCDSISELDDNLRQL